MNTLRYLTFEIGRSCPNIKEHAGRCPIAHPERYKFSTSVIVLSDETILQFWRWCRNKGFRGIILWHMYNEPVLEFPRIRNLIQQMKAEDKYQPFQLTTSIPGEYPDFNIVKISDYADGKADLDNRITTNTGEGKPYSEMPSKGWCGRGLGWEVVIDHFGNWCLCCGDWRCEESVGSVCNTQWQTLYERWLKKRSIIKWYNEVTYNSLPRLCRACLDRNPTLSKRGGI